MTMLGAYEGNHTTLQKACPPQLPLPQCSKAGDLHTVPALQCSEAKQSKEEEPEFYHKTAATGKSNLTHSAGTVGSCFKSSWQRRALPAVLGTPPTMAEVGSEKMCVCLAQSYDAMPQLAQQRSEGMHSRSCWYSGTCQEGPFS